jgi:hypothetical protein
MSIKRIYWDIHSWMRYIRTPIINIKQFKLCALNVSYLPMHPLFKKSWIRPCMNDERGRGQLEDCSFGNALYLIYLLWVSLNGSHGGSIPYIGGKQPHCAKNPFALQTSEQAYRSKGNVVNRWLALTGHGIISRHLGQQTGMFSQT